MTEKQEHQMRKRFRRFDDLLQDGQRLRVSLAMMDGMDFLQRAVARHSARVTDANGNSGLALHCPGWRCLLDDAAGEHAKAVAYWRADAEMMKAWRNPPTDAVDSGVCPECDGSGSDENGQDDCLACGGTGIVDADYESKPHGAERDAETHHASVSRRRSDSRYVNEIVRDHQANMARIYADHDRELTQAWRRS